MVWLSVARERAAFLHFQPFSLPNQVMRLMGFWALPPARVAELADALDLGSSGQPWGFDSPLSHHFSFSSQHQSNTLIRCAPAGRLSVV